VLDSKVVFPIVGETLVEASVLFCGDFFGLAHPDGLDLVKHLVFSADFLNLLGLLLLFFSVFDLGLIVLLFSVFVVIVVGVSDFLLGGLLDSEGDGERNKFGVLLNQLLEAAFFEVLTHILFEVKYDLGTTGKLVSVVGRDSESTTSVGFPTVLVIIVVLGDDNDFLSYQVGGVETHTELTNHTDISTSRDGFHEGTSTRLGNSSQVVNKVRLLHTNTGILDSQSVVSAVRNN